MANTGTLAFLFLIVGAVAVACVLPLTPTDFDIPQGEIHSLEVGSVNVRGNFGLKGKRVISAGTANVSVDEDEYTTAVLSRLAEQLREQGVRVEPTSNRTIEIQVARVSVHPKPQFTCVIDYNLRLGAGPLQGLQSRSKAWAAQKACSAAASQVVIDTLNDPSTRNYLRGE